MKTLEDLLCMRTGQYLFLYLYDHNLPLPVDWSEEDIKDIVRAYRPYDVRTAKSYLRVLEDWEDDQYEPLDEEELEKLDEESARISKRQWDNLLHDVSIGRKLRYIEDERRIFAKIIAEHLLSRKEIESFLLYSVDTQCMIIIEDIYNGVLKKDEEGYYPFTCDSYDRHLFSDMQDKGYVIIRETDPYDEDDDRAHYTGILLSEDVLAIIKEMHTSEFEHKRSMYEVFDHLLLLQEYYYTAEPVGILYKLYRRWQSSDPKRIPKLTEKQFSESLKEFCQNRFSSLFNVSSRHGVEYLYNVTMDDFPDEDTQPEDNMIAAYLYNWENAGTKKPYLPSIKEMQNFIKYTYWEARKPFRDLYQFLWDALEENYSMNSALLPLITMGMDPEEKEEYRRRHFHSRDQIEDELEDTWQQLVISFADYVDEPEKLYEELNHITCWYNDYFQNMVLNLVKKCCNNAPLYWQLGHSQVQTDRLKKKAET